MEDRNLYGKAYDVERRGRFATFAKAIDAALADLCQSLAEKNDFFDSLVDRWPHLFPTLKAVPGRYEDGIIFLYVRSAPLLFSIRPRLPAVRSTLSALPGAPRKIVLRLEIHAQ